MSNDTEIAKNILLICKPNYSYVEDLEEDEFLSDYWVCEEGRHSISILTEEFAGWHRQVRVVNNDGDYEYRVCLLIRKRMKR